MSTKPTTLVPDYEQLPCHHELIECPSCHAVQVAKVVHTCPDVTYLHHCHRCNSMITQDNWVRRYPKNQALP